jgi:hypothetical protein
MLDKKLMQLKEELADIRSVKVKVARIHISGSTSLRTDTKTATGQTSTTLEPNALTVIIAE